MSITVVGSLNVDYVVRVTRFPRPGETLGGERFQTFAGGKGANQACAAARLGARVRLVGQVGDDPQGDWILTQLSSDGVNVSGVRRTRDTTTGVALITVAADGQNHIVIVPGANGTMGEEWLDAQSSAFDGAAAVLLQWEIPDAVVLGAARRARASGARVLLDPAPARPVPDGLLPLCDYVTPNESELASLAGARPATSLSRAEARQLADVVRRRGASKVVVKMGAAGVLLVDGRGAGAWDAPRVDAVDTTAAGDCFNGAFAVALSEGRSEPDAVRFAMSAASLSVTRAGAQPSMPSRVEVEAFSATRALD
jgi:ribokinase